MFGNPIFMGIIIENYDRLLPLFLRSIEKIEYDKNMIFIQINVHNHTKVEWGQMERWFALNKSK